MKFAKVVFLVAGIYGLLVLLPQYFLEDYNGRNYPPRITHPEYFYGFIGVAVAWQVLFLILARDPVRFRPLMIPAVLEKLGFGVAAVILYLQHRVSPVVLVPAALDLILAALFVVAYAKTPAGRESKGKQAG
ncbi:MAG TPA: hypothetical protein VEX70_07120 [Pyrinomonadaceae bacterium]|nr:hypothetical protein [Pyrinomonadaceae bacterium]